MKLKESWAIKLPWAKFYVGLNGNLHIVKCRICNEVEGNDRILVAKWNFLYKHASQQKTKKIIKTNVKKGELYYSQICKHAINHKLFVSHNRQIVVAQLGNGDARKKGRKVAQFAKVLNLLQQGQRMLEYEAMKPLHEFFAMLKTSKKHWSDNYKWTIAKFMHQQVL